tara:strand:+ start:1681 stop:3474 length:1794 start_codon:yes stop_codon:yes gene_type:complete
MATKKIPVKYTSREFDTIKSDLMKYAKRYYPETYRDFGAASMGSMYLGAVSYVGDMLSFYLDYQVNELFLETATEYDNIIKLAAMSGYNYEGRAGSVGEAEIYAIIPANSTGLGPDTNYLPVIEAGTTISSDGGSVFTTTEDARLDDSRNQVVVARVNDTTGVPTHYAVRVPARVVSGEIRSLKIDIGDYEKFKKVKLSNVDVSEVISVVDTDGHEYYQVDYLSQDVVYRDVTNRGTDSDTVPSVLRPFVVPRRFVVERLRNTTFLQFGHGTSDELTNSSVSGPAELALKMHGRSHTTDKSFDPSKLMSTDKFGIAPANTTIVVNYRVNTSSNVNVGTNGLTKLKVKKVKFGDSTSLSVSKMRDVEASLEVSNSNPIVGGVSLPDITEIKRRSKDSYAAQNRGVTKQDLEAMAYTMPVKFGAIKRCRVRRKNCTSKRNIELYVLSEGTDGKLTTATDTLKQNLKIWLSEKKMMNDSIDIRDAKIVNYGVEFSINVDQNENSYEVLSNSIKAVQDALSEPLYVGEPLYISDIYGILNKVRGVVDAKMVRIANKTGVGYSSTFVKMDDLLSADGLTAEAPENVALEIKYPASDIKGVIV